VALIDATLAALAAKPTWKLVEDTGDLLRRGGLQDNDVACAGTLLVDLAAHPRWEIRKAVAHAIQHLHHPTFQIAVSRLLDDDNSFVRSALESTLARRAERAQSDTLSDQHADLLRAWVSGLEERHGAKASREAIRIAERYAGTIIKMARHEIIRAISPVDASLSRIGEVVSRSKVDRKDVGSHVVRAQQCMRHLGSIVKFLGEVTCEVVPEFAAENLHEVLVETIAQVRDRWKDRKEPIQVALTCVESFPIVVHRSRLVQALSNVLNNAFEAYSKDRAGRVRVAAGVRGESAVITIVDSGCGMNQEMLSDAFHLFSTSKAGGTGVGLTIAKKIIESEHGGTISLTSTEGRGTTATIVLPLEQESRQESNP
jgi:signal transduction histidine kinase